MRKSLLLNSALVAVAVVAYENKTGWKVDADGKLVVDADGNPIFINAGGQEQSVKGDTISNLNAEAKQHRTAKEAAEAELNKFKVDGKLIDPDTARKAVETVSKLDAKKLIDAGEVDKVRDQISQQYTQQIDELKKAAEASEAKAQTLQIDNLFNGSDFVRNNLAVPADMFRATFGNNVKIEDGKPVFYGRDGNRLMSKKNMGQFAEGDEAFELMVEQHPQKEIILRAPDASGSGNNGGGGNRGTGTTIRRADFEKLSPQVQAEKAQAVAKGELTIAD